MIRHGSPYMTVAFTAHWPMTKHVPFPELCQAQGIPATKTNAASNLTPYEIALIGTAAALLDRQRLPAETIPKPKYP